VPLEEETSGLPQARNAHFLPTGPFLCILYSPASRLNSRQQTICETKMNRYPRDMHGYGPTPPNADWPGGAHVAVQFVLNYEEGGENNILHGDAASEAFLVDVLGAAPWPDQRHANVESMYEYGARAGFWRLHRLFTEANLPVTIYGVATALMRAPAQLAAMQEAGWEIASHGLKWVQHKDMPPD